MAKSIFSFCGIGIHEAIMTESVSDKRIRTIKNYGDNAIFQVGQNNKVHIGQQHLVKSHIKSMQRMQRVTKKNEAKHQAEILLLRTAVESSTAMTMYMCRTLMNHLANTSPVPERMTFMLKVRDARGKSFRSIEIDKRRTIGDLEAKIGKKIDRAVFIYAILPEFTPNESWRKLPKHQTLEYYKIQDGFTIIFEYRKY